MGNKNYGENLARLVMPFGRHKGQSLTRIALTDYPAEGKQHAQTGYEYLFGWLRPTVSLSDSLLRGLSHIERALNSFSPVVNCDSCNNSASNLALIYDYKDGYDPADRSYFCSESRCRPVSDSSYDFVLKPLKFDTILEFSKMRDGIRRDKREKFVPREVISYIHDRLLTATGTKERNFTDEYAARFIESLQQPRKLAEPGKDPASSQLELF